MYRMIMDEPFSEKRS